MSAGVGDIELAGFVIEAIDRFEFAQACSRGSADRISSAPHASPDTTPNADMDVLLSSAQHRMPAAVAGILVG
ncbi:MAG: hypothetical protein ACR2KV_00610 [Solirubrobacteraceae bacterium]